MAQRFDARNDNLGLLEIPGVVLRTAGTNMARGVTWTSELMDMAWDAKPTVHKTIVAGIAKCDASIESFLEDAGVDESVDRFDVEAVSAAMRKHDKEEKAKRQSLDKINDFIALAKGAEKALDQLKKVEEAWNKLSPDLKKNKAFKAAYEAAKKQAEENITKK